jgi:hypothetical protein
MNTATSPRHERDILQDAAAALSELDRLHSVARALDTSIEALCAEYGVATRRLGYAPNHLRQACAAQGLLP